MSVPATALPAVPLQVIDAQGHPRFGTYSGELKEVRLDNLAASYPQGWSTNLLRRKRWHYTLIATPEVLVATATADLGYVANAFLCAVDLGTKRVLVDESYLGVPGPLAEVGNHPGPGLSARFVGAGGRFASARAGGADRYRIDADLISWRSVSTGGVRLRAEVLAAGAAPALTVVAPVPGGIVNVTQKSNAMLVDGTFRAAGRTFHLDGGVAGMDATHGLLARETAWRWAFACGRLPDGTPLGLNLVEGFNDTDPRASENALWVGGELRALPRARFRFQREDVLAPWEISSEEGGVRLAFRPIHAHRELKDFKIFRSRFVQVLGIFSGEVRRANEWISFDGIPGVTEDQDMLW